MSTNAEPSPDPTRPRDESQADAPPADSALILVDIQPDFLPGGSLAVDEGDRILGGVRSLMVSGDFPVQVATQDWHPPNHRSFASNHDGGEPFGEITLHGHPQVLWPDHCVQDTPGAELHPELPWQRVSAIIRKGLDPEVDSYSGFRNNWGPDGSRPATGLAGLLRERGVGHLVVCGLARDYCVRWTVEDALDEGFAVTLVWDLTRSVDPSGDEELHAGLADRGARILNRADLKP
ncbi:MAG: bifunctional nicotinamidase/pyrazinamidase [Gemmatimonadales bacterium]|nr:MAG: bifunctional nicotinamidase/pyrazinamidase [Gemmatimonadales bacterium]